MLRVFSGPSIQMWHNRHHASAVYDNVFVGAANTQKGNSDENKIEEVGVVCYKEEFT